MLANSGPSDDLDGVVLAPSLHLDRQKFYWPTREIHPSHAHTNGLHGELRRSHLGRAAACRYALQVCPRETFDHTGDGVNEGWVGVGEGLGANGRF